MAGSQTLERRVGYSASREMSCAALSATPYLPRLHRVRQCTDGQLPVRHGTRLARRSLWWGSGWGAFQGNRLKGRLYPTLSMRGTRL